MENLKPIKKIIEDHKKELEGKFYVKNIAIFGSYVKGTQTENSDIDILVEFNKPI